MGYSFWLAARVLLYAPSHRQDSTYHNSETHNSIIKTKNKMIYCKCLKIIIPQKIHFWGLHECTTRDSRGVGKGGRWERVRWERGEVGKGEVGKGGGGKGGGGKGGGRWERGGRWQLPSQIRGKIVENKKYLS